MEIKKKVLGKGLSALIPDHYTAHLREKREDITVQKDSSFQEINVADIKPNQDQPRQEICDEGIAELAQSIREQGVLQPVIVKQLPEGFELICGERRMRAVIHLGYQKIPAIVKDVADKKLLELALVENIQREDLNPIEEAQAYLRLVEERGYTQEQVADRVGKSRAAVANAIRLLRLPREVLDALKAGRIQEGHARALLALPTPEHQRQLAARIVKDELSVRQVESIVSRRVSRKRRARQARKLSPELIDLENKLEKKLGTQVQIFPRKHNQGRVEIQYYSLDDLDRLLHLLNIPNS